MGIFFTPFQYYYNGLELTIGNFFGLSIISASIILIGLKGLIETNSIFNKWNIFSINTQWRHKKDSSFLK
jgi:hypothetical protein